MEFKNSRSSGRAVEPSELKLNHSALSEHVKNSAPNEMLPPEKWNLKIPGTGRAGLEPAN